MKIRKHRIRSLKWKTRPDEEIRFSSVTQEQTLHRTHAGCSGAHRSPRRPDLGHVLFCNKKPLGMQRLASNRLKRSQPDVQSHISNLGSRPQARLQYFRSEVQTGGGSRDGAGLACKYRLISFAIFWS